MHRIASRFERTRPSKWPLVGILALGLVAGAAIGGLAMSQRWRMERLSELVRRARRQDTEMGMHEGDLATVIPVPRSNDRRKATSEA